VGALGGVQQDDLHKSFSYTLRRSRTGNSSRSSQQAHESRPTLVAVTTVAQVAIHRRDRAARCTARAERSLPSNHTFGTRARSSQPPSWQRSTQIAQSGGWTRIIHRCPSGVVDLGCERVPWLLYGLVDAGAASGDGGDVAIPHGVSSGA
jgi:hypothetical protein